MKNFLRTFCILVVWIGVTSFVFAACVENLEDDDGSDSESTQTESDEKGDVESLEDDDGSDSESTQTKSDEKGDLPAGWESAELVTNFFVEGCGGSSLDFDESIEVKGGEDFVRIDVNDAHFRCVQPVQGFYMLTEKTVDVLIQPVEMDPDGVANCDCGYNIVLGISEAPPGEIPVNVYRRWDHMSGSVDPVLIGTATASIGD